MLQLLYGCPFQEQNSNCLLRAFCCTKINMNRRLLVFCIWEPTSNLTDFCLPSKETIRCMLEFIANINTKSV